MIWYLRHAQAFDQPVKGGGDDDRLLTPLGELQAKAAGKALRKLEANIDVILSSPKMRALLTAQTVSKYLEVDVTIEPTLSGPFDAHALASDRKVLIVSHEPSMSYSIRELTNAQVRLRRGSIAQTQPGELVSLWLPSAVAAIARMKIEYDGDTIDLQKDDQLPSTTRSTSVTVDNRDFILRDRPIFGKSRIRR